MKVRIADLHHEWRALWPLLWPLLEPALRRSPDRPMPDGPPACVDAERWLLERLQAHDTQLWAVFDGGTPIAAVVTAIQDGGAERRCLLWLIGGRRARDWADGFLALVEGWARALGCTALWGSGRRGWARVVEPRGFRRIPDLDGQPAWQRRIR
ncbi:MAG: hypothetical protein JOY64_15915 [Alphaproteobacteria bacterium]|nr:hypothetical protein [Alphaproteobacteria bacterium]MBV8409116.1 hypothetical protein [Alphaproteobacteria bacterium]